MVTNMKAVALALLVSIVLVFSLGCVQTGQPVVQEPAQNVTGPQQNVTPPAQVQPCSEGNVVQKDDCFLALAKKEGKTDICKNIYSIEKVDDCYGIFAANDLETCRKVTDAQKRAACITANAKRLKDADTCNLIDNDALRGQCLGQVVSPCMAELDEGKRALCLALEKGDYTKCQSDSCFRAYAENRSDENACGLIKVESARFACVAVVRKDVSACKLASQSPIQDACVEEAAIALGSLDGCAVGTVGSDYVNRCYLYFAVKDSDMNVCKRAAPEEMRDWCYMQFSNETANVSACPRVEEETINRISCYRQAAIGNRMPSLCNPLAIDSIRRDCYAASILYLQNGPLASDCPKVYSDDWRNKCYLTAAKFSYNGTLCTFISEGPDRNDCNDLFGQ